MIRKELDMQKKKRGKKKMSYSFSIKPSELGELSQILLRDVVGI